MSRCTAVLIDTVSIQKYIFSSNKLRENLGASHLVKLIYQDYLRDVLKGVLGKAPDLDAWRKAPGRISMNEVLPPDFEVGFIGGGKALLFFDDGNQAKSFIKQWSRDLLVRAPGLNTAIAMLPDFNIEQFSAGLELLFKQLAINKNYFFPVTTLLGQGITAVCTQTGLSVEGSLISASPAEREERYLSSVSLARMNAADDEMSDYRNMVREAAGSDYLLSANLDQLGQKSGEDNYIAIVHADANGMGRRFQECSSLESYRKLARSVEQATREAFQELIQYVGHMLIPALDEPDSRFRIQREGNRAVLPLRPIILGGDDITFVTDGRLGVLLAQKLLEFWAGKTASDGNPLLACAGVSIIKTKYPFYRGYELAEQLCANAKSRARDMKSRAGHDSAWLDFHLAYGGIIGPLEHIRSVQMEPGGLKLHFGPYCLANRDISGDESFEILKTALAHMADESRWPRSKIKELRTALYGGYDTLHLLIQDFKARGLELPGGYSYPYQETGCVSQKTPYHDVLELLEYYPVELFGEGGV